MNIIEKLQSAVFEAIKSAYPEAKIKTEDIVIEYPKDSAHGDYATTIAMALAKNLSKSPVEIARSICANLKNVEIIEGTPTIAGAGFINFSVSKKTLIAAIKEGEANVTSQKSLLGKRIYLEFACPNTHKAFHIGHLRNVCLGEAMARLLESQGANVFRGNYQGDVGPHTAKCLWGIMNLEKKDNFVPLKTAKEAMEYAVSTLTTPRLKADYLGYAYSYGALAYENDTSVQEAIKKINTLVYAKDPKIIPLWEITRQWSLQYFESIYSLLGTHFDAYLFEGMMYEKGKQFVQEHMKESGGIFEKSDGAIVFKGEDYGLHTRVFITKDGNATYEGKEMANILTERSLFDFDLKLHIIAHDQSGYFEVIKKASELIDPSLTGKQHHVAYGLVKLTTGKMASRTGNVVKAEDLYEDALCAVKNVMKKENVTAVEFNEISQKIALCALKFTMLHSDSKKDIAFDLEQSVKLSGDSGPYLLYSLTRINSILAKMNTETGECDYSLFNEQDYSLAKNLLKFSEVVAQSAHEYTTHTLAHFLLEVASEFSTWYEQNRVVGVEIGLQNARLHLIKAIGTMMKSGLNLLGIEAVEKM